MIGLGILIVLLCLLIATGSALFALRLYSRSSDDTHQEREAWQQAQEGRQRTWEVRQEKHRLDSEKKLADQLKEARGEWRAWSMQAEQKQQTWQERASTEQEIARLPHIEHLELALDANGARVSPERWRPPTLYAADLRGRDLAHRFMERADLREAQLTEASLYMTDLAGASLRGANLERADLMSANLAGADLRGTNLRGANFLVTDLHNAVLHGANLSGARNLTPEQLQTAIYDSTTTIDSSIDITLPRIPGVSITPSTLLSVPQGGSQNTRDAVASSESEPSASISRTDEMETVEETAFQAPAEPAESEIPITPLEIPREQTAATAQQSATSEPQLEGVGGTTHDTALEVAAEDQELTSEFHAPHEESEAREQRENRKIIQLPTRAGKITRRLETDPSIAVSSQRGVRKGRSAGGQGKNGALETEKDENKLLLPPGEEQNQNAG